MFSMSKLRDNSKIFNGVLLFFFVLSMTVGGLVGGANILTTMRGWFGDIDTNQYVGKVGDENITVRTGDGYKGWPEEAPFDRIMVTAAPNEIPEKLHPKINGRCKTNKERMSSTYPILYI